MKIKLSNKCFANFSVNEDGKIGCSDIECLYEDDVCCGVCELKKRGYSAHRIDIDTVQDLIIDDGHYIELKPIKNETFTEYDEFYIKLNEEIDELKTALITQRAVNLLPEYYGNYENSSKENLIEEFYDVIQSMLQIMTFEGLTVEEITQGQEKHFNKLMERGWEFNA